MLCASANLILFISSSLVCSSSFNISGIFLASIFSNGNGTSFSSASFSSSSSIISSFSLKVFLLAGSTIGVPSSLIFNFSYILFVFSLPIILLPLKSISSNFLNSFNLLTNLGKIHFGGSSDKLHTLSSGQ